MRQTLLNITLCVFLLLLAVPSYGDLVINEVMSNEPGGSTSLEWIEIYNNTSTGKSLAFYIFEIDGVRINPDFYIIDAHQYFILARDTVNYEATWGNGNGHWGDDPILESYPVGQLSGIGLKNDSGNINLIFNLPPYNIESQFNWSSAGADGVSWERLYFDSLQVKNSIDPTGSTPGRVNSVKPRDYDLGLASIAVWPDEYGRSGFDILVVNFGLNVIEENILSLYYDLDHDSLVQPEDLIATIDIPLTFPGDTVRAVIYLELDGVYPDILIQLPDDDQPFNNMQHVSAFGVEYPPIILNEFLPDPRNEIDAEWVELKNRSENGVNLNNWFLGDSIAFYPITDSDYTLNSGDYIVLCKDSVEFVDYYGSDNINILRMSSWPSLNNKSDSVRLKDNFGFIADRFYYSYIFGDNHSWSRSEDSGKTESWGRSVAYGGSPGQNNEVYLQPSADRIKLAVTPDPFSPRLDGEMEISFELPPGENVIVKIYDLEGRVVKTLADNLPPYDGLITWAGDSEAGRPLPVGMYILYIEVSGIDSYKRTIVIAP